MPAAWANAQAAALIDGPGAQFAPARTGNLVAFLEYLGDASPGLTLADYSDPNATSYVTLEGNGVIGEPRAADGVIAYRVDGHVRVYSGASKTTRELDASGAGVVAVSSTLTAWVQDEQGRTGEDIAWAGPRGAALVVPREGTQHSPAVAYGWVAYIDESDGGAVHLIDTSLVATAEAAAAVAAALPVYPGLRGRTGEALEVAIWAADPAATPVVAVLVDGAAGAEIVFLDPSRSVPSGADPAVPDLAQSELKRYAPRDGGMQHLRMNGSWVAYEALSSGTPWVTAYEWIAERAFQPPPSLGAQTLGGLDVVENEVRVVWSQLGAADLDVWQYRRALPLEEEPGPVDGDVTCADPLILPIVEFTVTADESDVAIQPQDRHRNDDDDDDRDVGDDDRDDLRKINLLNDRGADGWHVRGSGAHDERWHADRKWRDFEFWTFDAEQARRVVVCMDAVDVASAWVEVGSEVVAAPADFSMGTVSLEARVTVPEGQGNAGAVVIAKRSGTLRVRVLDDPEGDVNGLPEGSTCSARGDCPPPPRGILSKLNCGSSGGAGSLVSLLVIVGLLAARPSRRRTRS